MMIKKQPMKYLVAMIVTLTLVCILLGVFFHKTEAEKINGLSNVFDAHAEGLIAYVSYDQGKPGIYVHTKTTDEQAIELSPDQHISDLAFSPDGNALAYVVNQDGTANLYTMDTDTFDSNKVFQDEAYFTEIAYDPKDASQIFYLRAGTFENYSPIAQAKPHEFDVYSYDTTAGEETKYTNLAAYDMESLTIAEDTESFYVSMVDDTKIDTAEESFSVGKRIFRFPLDQPEQKTAINMPAKDVYDFTVLPDRKGIIYQTVSKTGEDGIFQYELFHHDTTAKESEQLTNLQSHASRPVLAPNHETIYFIVNRNFAGKHADNRLYQMNIDGTGVTHLPLEQE